VHCSRTSFTARDRLASRRETESTSAATLVGVRVRPQFAAQIARLIGYEITVVADPLDRLEREKLIERSRPSQGAHFYRILTSTAGPSCRGALLAQNAGQPELERPDLVEAIPADQGAGLTAFANVYGGAAKPTRKRRETSAKHALRLQPHSGQGGLRSGGER
jgi:hypothetical protein